MAWFDKSKAEKEAQKRREAQKGREERQDRENEEYEKLMDVMKRIEQFNPVWTIEKIDHYDEGGFYRSIFYRSPDGICVRIKNVHWSGQCYCCSVYVYREITIYNKEFCDGYNPQGGASLNLKAFNYLNNYLKPIFKPYYLQMNQAREKQEKRDQDIIDKFWKG